MAWLAGKGKDEKYELNLFLWWYLLRDFGAVLTEWGNRSLEILAADV